MTSGSLQNCYRDEIYDLDDRTSIGKSFEHKTKILGKTPQRPAQPDPHKDENQQPHSPV